MKKLMTALLAVMLTAMCALACAQAKEVTVELSEEVLAQLVTEADYGYVKGNKIDLRIAYTNPKGIFGVHYTGRLLIRNNPIILWGLPQEDGSLAVAKLTFGNETYVYVTSKKGDGLIPLGQVIPAEGEGFMDKFEKTPGGYHKPDKKPSQTEKKPAPTVDNSPRPQE